jgi:hypothetical protein
MFRMPRGKEVTLTFVPATAEVLCRYCLSQEFSCENRRGNETCVERARRYRVPDKCGCYHSIHDHKLVLHDGEVVHGPCTKCGRENGMIQECHAFMAQICCGHCRFCNYGGQGSREYEEKVHRVAREQAEARDIELVNRWHWRIAQGS